MKHDQLNKLLESEGLLNERHLMAKNKGGRPTKYNPYYPEIAEAFCREDGYTDKQLAGLFGCTESCINSWKSRYPEFFVSIKKGKWLFDTHDVENAMLKSALGYSYNETTKELVGEVVNDKGMVTQKAKLKVTKIVTKHAAPNPTSIIFWTKNRKPEDWEDNKKIDVAVIEDEGQLSEEELKKRLKAYEEADSALDMASVTGAGEVVK